jgi:hypothetical protein
MPERTKGNLFVSKFDELQEEYALRRRLDDNSGDLFMGEPRDHRIGSLNCRFKDNCYALKSNTGSCPCGLEDE